jgi:alpha-1,2-mannosyltransferase
VGRLPVDLAVYRQAGRVVRQGIDLYGPAFRHPWPHLAFTYPPFAALISVPLDLVPGAVLVVAWTCGSLLLLLGMVRMVLRPYQDPERAGVRHGLLLGLAAGAVMWTVPLRQNLSYGQVNVLIASACITDCLLVRRGRGVLVGLATAVKLTPGLFIVYFAASRQRAAAMRAALTAAACSVLGVLVLPGPSREYWLRLFFHPQRLGRVAGFLNQSLYGMAERLRLPLAAWAVGALGAAGVGLWRASRAHGRGDEVAAVALVGVASLLVSPVSWQHHAVWIVPSLATLAVGATSLPRITVAMGALALFTVPLPSLGHRMPHEGLLAPVSIVLENAYVLGYLALMIWLPVHRGRAGRADLPPRAVPWRPRPARYRAGALDESSSGVTHEWRART